MDLLKSIINIPGDLLQTVANLLPSSKKGSTFDDYCKKQGGKIVTDEDGNKHCDMSMRVSEGHWATMMGGEDLGNGMVGFKPEQLPKASFDEVLKNSNAMPPLGPMY